MQYSQEHLKTMVYAEFGGQTECIMGNSKIENDNFKEAVRKWEMSEMPAVTKVKMISGSEKKRTGIHTTFPS